MSNIFVDKTKIDFLANAIAAKTGESIPMTFPEMTQAIDSIGDDVPKRMDSDLINTGPTIIVPWGYYESEVSKNVTVRNPADIRFAYTINFENANIIVNATPKSGYYYESTKSYAVALSSVLATTWTTSTADRYISSRRWLVGSQTIKSVTTSNLLASNIKSGVTIKVGDAYNASRITQVTGTYEPTTSILTVTPTSTTQTFNATGVYGYKPVTVEAVPSASINVGVSSGFTDSFGERGWWYRAYYNATSAGWVNSGIVTPTMSVLRAISSGTTITPTTTNKTVGGANWMMESAITVLGDANLVASNIADGVSIFGVNGTHQGGGGGYTVDDIAMRTMSGDISGNATYIGNYAFISCSTLTTVSFPNATSIGHQAFYDCSALTTANFPNATTISSYAFQYCSALTTVSFPNATSIGNYAFRGCLSLTTVDFPSTTYIGSSAFMSCSTLTTISFPNATSIGGYAFRECYRLTTANFPSTTYIGSNAFQYCYSLTTASFPSVSVISYYAFASCIRLTTADFPSATDIGSNAFLSCHSLTTISFPNATTISNYAFTYCYNLLSFYLLGSSIPTLGTNVFGATPIGGYTTSTGGVYGSIFVPSSLYDQYIVATNWSEYSSRIVSV